MSWRDAEYQNTPTALARYFAMKSGTGTGTSAWEYEAKTEPKALTPWPELYLRCWRAKHCLAAKVVEVEVEIDVEVEAERQRQLQRAVNQGINNLGQQQQIQQRYRANAWPGFAWQEMEGVGGVMKGKKKVKVGVGSWVAATAPAAGQDPDAARNWCGWCERVVLGRNEHVVLES